MVNRDILVDIIKEAAKLESGDKNEPDLQSVSGFKPIDTFDYDNNGTQDKYITYEGTGFAATAYRNEDTNEVIIAYRGTNSKELVDWVKNNWSIGINEYPVQYTEANHFYNLIAKEYGKENVTVIGHSLGGALAQLVGAENNVKAVTFNAPGVLHLLDSHLSSDPSSYKNITNYCLENEVLNILNTAMGYQLLGTTFILPSDGKSPIGAHLNYDALKSKDFMEYSLWKSNNETFCKNLEKYRFLGSLVPILFGDGGVIPQMFKSLNLLGPLGKKRGVPTGFAAAFNSAEEVIVPKDPLVIDLDGDGLETTTVENGVYFDHESDGFAELSAWVGKDDGVLVYDKNGNGRIDDGNEIFGDNYVKTEGSIAESGFDALADFDSNGDGKIDSTDTQYGDIKILKGDGTLLTLTEAGISSIELESSRANKTDTNGNKQVTKGTYTKTDGTTGVLGDFLLQQDTTNSIATEWIEVSEEIAELPDIPGMGEMYSLHQAMARDEALTELVKTFKNATDVTERQSLVIQIIYKWSGAEDVASDSRGTAIDAKNLVALEKFVGRTFDGERGANPTSHAANFLNNGFAILRDYVYSELTSQTFLKPLYQMLELEYNEDLQKYVYNLDNVQNYIDETIEKDLTSGRELLLDFTKTFINLGLQETSNYQDFEEHYIEMGDDFKLLMQSADKVNIYGTESDDTIDGTAQQEAVFGYNGNDTIYTRQGDDLVYGGDGNDVIDTCEGNDVIYGESGNDTIESGYGDDIVYGGDGNDIISNAGGNDTIYGDAGDDTISTDEKYNETLIGGTGNDTFEDRDAGDETFIFNKGDGKDVIYNVNGNDTIKFGEGITLENIKFHGEGSDLFITFSDTDDSIQIERFISSTSYRIENFEFSDGTKITSNYVLSHLVTEGTDGDDTITGTSAAETIKGNQGNDTIESGYGDDIVYGGDGNDIISNAGGNDTIYGDAGDDTISTDEKYNETLIGGTGNDTFEDRDAGDETFIFNKGDGKDVIYNVNGNDTIKFGEGITLENIKFHGEGSDLFITFSDTDDLIQIERFISSTSYRIENFEFSDGTKITSDYVLSHLVTEGTSGDDTIEGTRTAETIYGYSGNDTIESGYGDDIVYGGDGNDTIDANNGNDIIYGEAGDDTIESGEGDDIVYGGDGNDTITNTNGNDIIYGGAGDDTIKLSSSSVNGESETLIGGTGNDYFEDKVDGDEIFIFNKGDGNDVIYNYKGNDTIKFGEGIIPENMKFSGIKNDLYITFTDSEDSIQIKSFFSSDSYRIEKLEFTDGTFITSTDILSMVVTEGTSEGDTIIATNVGETIYGHEGDDTIDADEGNDIVYGGAGNDTIESGYGDDTVYGGDGNDTITNSRGNDIIYGGAGDDSIESTSSNSNPTNETLIGGTGNDIFQDMDTGNETYIFNKGDGNDVITNYNGNDTIKFGEGITLENIKFHGEGSDLYITFSDSEDSIQIENFISSDYYKIENFEFSDSTKITSDYVLSYLVTEGTADDDNITGTKVNETIYGYGGDDTINSGYGDDTVYGGDGNDTITNSRGNDTIYGGAGDDSIKSTSPNSYPTNEILIGGTGNDTFQDIDTGDETFIFNKGDGNDVITNYNGNDTIKFGEGISLENIKFHGEGNNLFITFADSDDSIQINSFISSDYYKIENFEFSDGTKITSDYVFSHLVTEGTDGDDTITGTKVNETIYGYGGDDTINSGYGDDIVYGGNGNDTITNSRGNDTIYGGAGDDEIKSTSSNSNPTNETLIGGTGNDTFQDSDTGNETFIFNEGDGSDSIYNYGGTDTIRFESSVSKENIALFQDSSGDLFIDYGEDSGNDVIQIQNQDTPNYAIESFELVDDTGATQMLTSEDINKIIQDMSAYAADNGISISSAADVKENPDLMNLVANSWAA